MEKNTSLYSDAVPRRGPEEGRSASSPSRPIHKRNPGFLDSIFNFFFGTGQDMLDIDGLGGRGYPGYPEVTGSESSFLEGIFDEKPPITETDVHTKPVPEKTIGAATVSSNVTKKDEPEVILRDVDGWPLPVKDYRKGYTHCSETGLYHHDTAVVHVKGHSTLVLWPGKGQLGFCYYDDDGITCARIYDQNKNFVSHRYFQGKPSRQDIKSVLFDGAVWEKQVQEAATNDKPSRPYKVAYRHIILPKTEFDKQYTPNGPRTSTYGYHEDKALKSISKMLTNSANGEVESGAPASAFNLAHKEIRKNRRSYIVLGDEFPCVEIYAFWHNLDPAANLILSKYDSTEPVLYQVNHFSSPDDMENCPF